MADVITDELKKLMGQLIIQTDKDKKIRGILICKDESGKLVPSNVSIGDELILPESEIKKMKCPENTAQIGIFRSYPPTYPHRKYRIEQRKKK